MIIEIIYWILLLLVLSILGLPLSHILFFNSKLMSKFIFALPLAFITTGLISLIFFMVSGSLIIGCLISLLIHIFFLVKDLKKLNPADLRYLLITLLKFFVPLLLLFSFYLILRGFNLGLSGTEKLSDQMHLSSVYWANNGLIMDLWFSGKENPYYFFGYWMYGSLMRTIGIDPLFGYSLSLATTMVMATMVSWASSILIINISGLKIKYNKYITLIAPVSLLLITNYSIFWELLNIFKYGQSFISNLINIDGLNDATSLQGSGWRSTRVINYFFNEIQYDYTIQEYPAFSFHLGDLHPHFISIPYVIIFLSLIVQMFVNIRNVGLTTKVKFQSLFIGLIIPVTGLINIWDLPLMIFVYGITIIYSKFYLKNLKYMRLISYTIAGCLLGFILLSKYYLFTLGGQTAFPYISVNQFGTNIMHFVTVWGFFIIFIYLFSIFNKRKDKKLLLSLIKSIAISLIIIILRLSINLLGSKMVFLDSYLYAFITLVLLIFPLLLIFGEKKELKTKNFVLNIFLITSLTILIIVENIHLIDSFGNRMNTIFKAYYQVWIILSISLPLLLIKISSELKSLNVTRIIYTVIGLTISLSLVQNYSLILDNSNKFSKGFGFNNLEYQDNKLPGVLKSVDFIINNTSEDSIIYSGEGIDYADSSYFSVFTGRATPLGWPGHEAQWRGNHSEIYERKSDLKQLENIKDNEQLIQLLRKYKIDYYLVESNNKLIPKLQELFLNIYSDNQIKIYKTSELKID